MKTIWNNGEQLNRKEQLCWGKSKKIHRATTQHSQKDLCLASDIQSKIF